MWELVGAQPLAGGGMMGYPLLLYALPSTRVKKKILRQTLYHNNAVHPQDKTLKSAFYLSHIVWDQHIQQCGLNSLPKGKKI